MGRCDPKPNRVDSQRRAYKGSMMQLQAYVNQLQSDLDSALVGSISGLNQWPGIRWVSPVAQDSYREYSDQGFISALGLGPAEKAAMAKFWPRNGPCWDGLALPSDESSGALIVEAKSYPAEVRPSTGAGPESRAKITYSLERGERLCDRRRHQLPPPR